MAKRRNKIKIPKRRSAITTALANRVFRQRIVEIKREKRLKKSDLMIIIVESEGE